MVLVLVTAGAVATGAAAYASVRARVVADLSAVAGSATAVQTLSARGTIDPCLAALAVALENGASLRECRLDGGVNVSVEVEVALPGLVRRWHPASHARAAARAGPEPRLLEPSHGSEWNPADGQSVG